MAIEWKKIAFVENSAAQSILGNPTGSPAVATAITVAEQTLVGRITGGNVDDLSVAQVKTMLGITVSGSSIAVHQVSHGFAVGDLVYLDSTTYKKADCTTEAKAEVAGMVTVVTGNDDFTLTTSGWTDGLTGLTAGAVYFLSSTAGAMTVTAPTTEGYVDKPVFLADTTTSGFVLSMRGVVIAASAVSDTAFGTSWNGETETAPSKNVVYDELQARPRRNAIINGNMSVWQRGTTTLTNPANGTYFADRFQVTHTLGDGAYNAICEAVTPAAGFPFTRALKIDCTHEETAVAAGEYMFTIYKMEGYDFVPFEGRTATLSFWVKATKTGVYCVSFRNSAPDKSYVAEYTVNTPNTWEKKTVTLTFNSGGSFLYTTGVGLYISWTVFCGSTYQTTKDTWASGNYLATSSQVNGFDSTDNNFSLTGVQLELGSVATEFEVRPYAEELALCQRYYERQMLGIAGYVQGQTYGVYCGATCVPKPGTPTVVRLSAGTTYNVYLADSAELVFPSNNSGYLYVLGNSAGWVYALNAIFEIYSELT